MTRPSQHRGQSRPPRRDRSNAPFGSVLLVLGAAALIGWLVAELYVAAVTAD